jgi:hypothetical protein
MASTKQSTDFPAKGKIIRTTADGVVFVPSGTNYEMELKGEYRGELNVPVELLIRAQGRKLLTVPAGGNFVAPIFGPPKTVQGRVLFVDNAQAVVHAGVNILVKLPTAEDGIDLNNGQISERQMVNVIVFPGATFEVVAAVGV